MTNNGRCYGYKSSAEYDFRFGQVTKSVDINGNEISYVLDNLGRVDKITGPYEKASGAPYTIDFIYAPDKPIPHAITKHYDPANPGNDLETVIFVDGLGRVLQTKKDAAVLLPQRF